MEADFELFPEFNNDECIKYIRAHVPEEDLADVSDEDIDDVLDYIYDYYEENGLIDEDDVSDAIIDETEEYQYVLDRCREDGLQLSEQQVQLILAEEYEYGVEAGIYDEVDE